MDRKAIDRIVKEALSLEKRVLTEPEAKEILSFSSISVPKHSLVKDVTGAIEAAETIGYPVVLKVVSPDITHKSDVGGVILGVKDSQELIERWSQIILCVADENPVAVIEGFLVEEMVPRGAEVIIGAVKDEQFGTYVMFGIGGIAVELVKDVSFRLGPVTRDEAFEMISEVKGYPLLTGFRGSGLKDLGAIADCIVKLSKIVDETDGLKELEINPLMVYGHGAIAVDARAVLG